MVKRFAKIINGFKLLTISTQSSTIDIWKVCEKLTEWRHSRSSRLFFANFDQSLRQRIAIKKQFKQLD